MEPANATLHRQDKGINISMKARDLMLEFGKVGSEAPMSSQQINKHEAQASGEPSLNVDRKPRKGT